MMVAGFLALAFSLWRIRRRIHFFLHVHQLEGYKTGPYLRWGLARPFDVVLRRSHVAGLAILLAMAFAGLPALAGALLWAVAFASSRRYRRDTPKKPLAWTARMRREAWATGTFGLLLLLNVVFLGAAPEFFDLLLALGLTDLLAPILVAAGAIVMRPVEQVIHEGFKRKARRKLRERTDLKVVAITGSYGKTSVKFAVAEVLGQRFQVLATPGSFNTPMGICKVINNDLRDHHQVLVLEMGIRNPGDIEELCRIARPDVAVITGIGIAHLESMGSQEAIAREKGSLLDYLKPGGVAVLNADDEFFRPMAEKRSHLSVSAAGESADLSARNVTFGTDGTSFVVLSESVPQTSVNLALLGRHNVGNALLALAVGKHLGVRLRAGSRALARLKPVPHRLALREEAGLLVLDDAFNSNPVGAGNAVEVLGAFTPRRRFIITPGMVELGPREFEENKAFGERMAGNVDEAILVGPARTIAISEGLREAGVPGERVHVVNTLFEARDLLRSMAAPGDVVLYENDLPDQYTEG